MTIHLCLAATMLCLGASLLASTPEELPLLAAARTALAEGIPQVAAAKAARFLADPATPEDQKDAALLLHTRALYACGEIEEAFASIQPLVERHLPGSLLLQGEILLSQGKWKEAQQAFHQQAQQPGGTPEATLGEAEAILAQGRTEEATGLLRAVVAKSSDISLPQVRLAALLAEEGKVSEATAFLEKLGKLPALEGHWRKYAEGQILLHRDQPAPALTLFEALLESRTNISESLFVAATFGSTQARVVLYGTEQADKVLETFIWRYPGSPYLSRAFRLLDQIYAKEEDPPEGEYHRWIQKGQVERAALARFYVGRLQARLGKLEKAEGSLEKFLHDHPDHALYVEACLLHADVLSRRSRFDEAERALESAMRHTADETVRAEIELRTGLIHYQQGEFLLAATQFETSARRSPATRSVATFNSALAWLARKSFDRFGTDFRSFVELQPTSALQSELALEEGLTQARAGEPSARKTLENFLLHFPQHSRSTEARLALAELALFSPHEKRHPARSQEEAGQLIRLIGNSSQGAAEIKEQNEYLAIWLEEAQESESSGKVIARARQFLLSHPASPWRSAVRLKLGQLYFNKEDFANAESFLSQAAQDDPASDFAEPALFLAGQAAAKLMNPGAVDRALASFDEVVRRSGPLKLYARQEQASIQSRMSREDQAIAIYDLILSAEPSPEPALRQATLCGRADCLLSQGRREKNDELIGKAATAYGELAATRDVLPEWRNQALFKRGKALEQLGKTDEAAEAYYDVLGRSIGEEREYFWLYKAGFEAAHLFEQQQQWKSAIGIYEKMAVFNGPRSGEARNQLKQLRLEHFIWD